MNRLTESIREQTIGFYIQVQVNMATLLLDPHFSPNHFRIRSVVYQLRLQKAGTFRLNSTNAFAFLALEVSFSAFPDARPQLVSPMRESEDLVS